MYVIIYFPSVYICTCMKKTVNKISIYLYFVKQNLLTKNQQLLHQHHVTTFYGTFNVQYHVKYSTLWYIVYCHTGII